MEASSKAAVAQSWLMPSVFKNALMAWRRYWFAVGGQITFAAPPRPIAFCTLVLSAVSTFAKNSLPAIPISEENE